MDNLSGRIFIAGKLRRFNLCGEFPPIAQHTQVPGTSLMGAGAVEYPDFAISISNDEVDTFQKMLEEEHPEPKNYEVAFRDNSSGQISGVVIVAIVDNATQGKRVVFHTEHIEKLPKNKHAWGVCPLFPSNNNVKMCMLCGCLKTTVTIIRGKSSFITKYLLNGDTFNSSPDCTMGGLETRLKRFQLFCYYTYYPLGGMADFIRDFNTIEEAKEYRNKYPNDIPRSEDSTQTVEYDNWHIYDSETNEVVAGFERSRSDFERQRITFPLPLSEYFPHNSID